MGRIKLLIAIILFSFNANAQTKIKGTIKNDKSEPIISASVILKDTTGKIVSYVYSNGFGKFEISTNKKGKFIMTANSMGFEINSIDVLIDDKDIHDVIFNLSPKINELTEVIVTSARPITIDGDKIIYDVKSFLQGNEQTVEDLLKKIPGLNIDGNGTIKVGNQEIEKVMIDGDDLFEKGYKILTKNMPVNPLDKVELLQNYSNNKHLKGIENSTKVALNLTLKEESKRVWFGNLQVGSSIAFENQYELRSNLMNFGKKNKYYFLTNLNNLGFDAIGDIDNLIRPQRSNEPGSIGDNQSVKSLLSLGTDLPNLKKRRVNLNNA